MLPLRNQAILDKWLRADADAMAVNKARSAHVRELRMQLVVARQRLDDLKEAGRQTDEAEADVARIEAAIRDAQADMARPGFGLMLKEALEASPQKKWKDYLVDPGNTDLTTLDQEIDALIAERGRVENAPLTLAEQKALIRSQLDVLADAPRVNNGRIEWPAMYIQGADGFQQHVIDSAALIAWLFGKEIEKRLVQQAEIETQPHALSRPERRRALRKLDSEILAKQRMRAALAETTGVPHRADAPFEAVLQIEAI